MAKMGRPNAVVQDAEKQVESLAAINCSWAEIGAVLGMGEKTVRRRFDHAYKKGREKGRMSLKRKMFDLAMGGNTVMCIWLSKQMCGYTDKVVQSQTATVNTSVTYKAKWGDTSEPTDDKTSQDSGAVSPSPSSKTVS